ncbi:heat stress transcription factor A-5-like [Telopea speciosissima]|uniref:heat stress transcription factor A-5-like n=1 Tax=Telopea speciosissima TaxID=54955 RepID=UPI001CC5C487|nr:heat stress transcription factor A-5-like [Telopea speciosissima]
MEGEQSGGGGGSGGPAPFLLKTYDMVDDSSTDEIVSWSANKNSFVVWNPLEFATRLLPTYFKHNNFSSFIRQLNTYGFRKIDPEKWEFANEDFVKDQKHLLKSIYRRKPIHSHSHPQGSGGDAERAVMEEEIEKLSQEKTILRGNLCRFRQQQSGTMVQLEDVERRVQDMEQRQLKMMTFLEKAVQNPTFVEHLVRMAGSSMDFSAINKKRRLPNVDCCEVVPDNALFDNHNSSSKPEIGHIFHQDFSNKLKLELLPAVSDSSNLVYPSVQSSNEDERSPQRRTSEGELRDIHVRMEGLSFTPETLDLADTGASFALKKDATLSRQVRENDNSRLLCLQHSLSSAEEGDGPISSHLNLTLASCALQLDSHHYSSRISQLGPEIGTSTELSFSTNGKDADLRVATKSRNISNDDTPKPSSFEAPSNNQGPSATGGRVNDVFWEQFLT